MVAEALEGGEDSWAVVFGDAGAVVDDAQFDPAGQGVAVGSKLHARLAAS